MYFSTFFITIATFAMVNATPAMVKRYMNETTSELPISMTSELISTETTSAVTASNVTAAIGGTVSTSITQSLLTTVQSATLTYTLGGSGASSVVTTVIESTSTITLMSTMYITLIKTEDATTSTEPATTISTANSIQDSLASESIAGEIGTASPASGSGDEATGANIDSHPSVTTSDDSLSAIAEPTITVTDYSTTTETITLEAVETNSAEDAAGGESVVESIAGGGTFFQTNGPIASSTLEGTQDGVCGVATVTATIVEMSTVTVTPTPTGTDNYPVAPTASSSYGNGNATDPFTGYPTASSGFLTFHKRTRPTRI